MALKHMVSVMLLMSPIVAPGQTVGVEYDEVADQSDPDCQVLTSETSCVVFCSTSGSTCRASLEEGFADKRCYCQEGMCFDGEKCKVKEEGMSTEERIMTWSIIGVLVISGLVIAYYDYKWADDDSKLAPRCQGPEGILDLLLALTIGLMVKCLFTWFIIAPVIAIIADDLLSFMCHLMLLGMFGMFMCSVCAPVACCGYLEPPTFHKVMGQFRITQMEIMKSKLEYLKNNIGDIVTSTCSMPLVLCMPVRFVTFGKALTITIFIAIWCGMSVWCYVVLRIVFAGATYKFFTLKGWVVEIKDSLTIKKRILSLDYQWVRDKHGDSRESNEGKSMEAGKMAAVQAGAVGADKAATVAGQAGLSVATFSVFAQLFSIACPVLCEFFTDFFVGFLFNFMIVGVAMIVADATIKAENQVPPIGLEQKHCTYPDASEKINAA